MTNELTNKLKINCLPFSGLSLSQLYDLMKLRQQVFVVEQNCPYLDADDIDKDSWHLLIYGWNEELLAYSRLIPTGISYADYASIGRVVVKPTARNKNFGKQLIERSLIEMNTLFGNIDIKIGAQSYLLKFYQSFGFQIAGDEYMEDGIPHTPMIKYKDL